MVIVRFHRKLHPKRELNSFVHQNIICRLSYESLKHPNHALLASESPAPCQGRCHMPLPPPWNFSQDLAWFLSLGGKFCASSWWKAVGFRLGVVSSDHPPKIWCCHCWKRNVGFCKTNLLCPTNTKDIEKNSSFNAQKVQNITFCNHVKLPLKGRSMSKYVLSFLSVLFCRVDFYVPSSKRHQTNLQSPGCCWRLCLIQLRMPRDICKAHKPQYLEALKQGGISGRSLSSKILKPKKTQDYQT